MVFAITIILSINFTTNNRDITLMDFSNQEGSDLQRLKDDHGQVETWAAKSIGIIKFRNQEKTELPTVKVAILDSGINKDHEDLKGLVVKEYNAISPNAPVIDELGHGTAIAGIIGAQNNDVGIIGISPNVQIYSVKVLDERGKGNIEALIRGLEWAIERKVNVINVSFGMSSNKPELRKVIDKAIDSGIIVVAAAGNKYGMKADFPAGYDKVLSVTAVNKNYKVKPLYSASGKIDFSLPGISCLTTSKDGKYSQYSGTSVAAAYMTGVVATILQNNEHFDLEMNDKDLPKSVFRILKEFSINLGKKDVYGNGFIKLS